MYLLKDYFFPVMLLIFLMQTGIVANAQNDTTEISDNDFFNMSFEEMLNMEVTSISKKVERMQDASSSLYVLTSEDISNSGATNLHEVLRMVPGYWGVQDEYSSVEPLIRNSPVSNGSRGTVLYLLDGTPIQDLISSSFSFNNFDISLDEIDRIEIIRGSGGTIYGANSATGVVNIFTKSPEKYDGFHAQLTTAIPNYYNLSFRGGGIINDKLSLSSYVKYRHFGGYGLVDGFEGDSVLVPLPFSGVDTNSNLGGLSSGDSVMIKNRFQEDFETTAMYSGGFKLTYKLGDKSKISFNSHANMAQQKVYTNFETENFFLGAPDSLVFNDISRSRIVGNLRLDHNFNDNHNFFIRFSTNIEQDFLKLFGGYKVNNSIYDFELQDNISKGKLINLSVGGNYRLMNFDVHGINDKEGVIYLDPQNVESSNGLFIQNKIKLVDEKLNFLIGLKAETYSLINDNYYLSPMAKVSYIPNETLTFWGGYTQSYTTPGYNNVNIDALILKSPSDESIDGAAFQNVYNEIYNALIASGSSETAATDSANSYMMTPGAITQVGNVATGLKNELNNIGVINGSETVPTKYQAWEIGFRANIDNKLSLESNFYYTTITDGIAPSASASPNLTLLNEERPGAPGIFADYYLYGNYIKGISYGTESSIKIIPSQGARFEVSHVYTYSEWELQENKDFDINDPKVVAQDDLDRTPSVPAVPKHVFRIRSTFQLKNNFSFTTDVLYATKFSTEANYSYAEQKYPSIIASGGIRVSENNSRTIINMKVQKKMMKQKLTIALFGNDIFNEGIIANTNLLNNVTLSQIGGMYGINVSYKF